MALTSDKTPAVAGDTPEASAPGKTSVNGSPAWTAPLFFLGMFLVFLGERVLGSTTAPRAISTLVGIGAILSATAVRWVVGSRSGGERARIERLLGVAQVVAVLAVAIALGSSSLGARLIGLDGLNAEERERWDTILLVASTTLLLCGLLPLLFAETALAPMRRAPLPESRRVISAASAGLALALALAYLGLFVASARHWGVAADFAYFKTAKPSDSTLKIAASLKEPIRVIGFFPAVNEVRTEVDRYLRAVGRTNPKVKVEFVDRVLQPKIAREQRVSQDGTVVLLRGEVRQTLNIGLEMKNARSTLRNFDQEFQKNLMKLARDTRVAYLTAGHHELNDHSPGADPAKERGVTGLRKLLEMQNFRVADLGMPQGLANEIPADANVVMVLGPTEPFAPQELGALKRYVERGGALLLALDPESAPDQPQTAAAPTAASAKVGSSAATPPLASAEPKQQSAMKHPTSTEGKDVDDKTIGPSLGASIASGGPGPNLEALAALAGLSVDSSVLANDKGDSVAFAGNKSDRTRIVTNRFGSHASVSTLSRHSAWVVLFGSGSLSKLDPNDKTVTFALHSTATTFPDRNGNFEADATETRSSFELAAAVARKGPAGASDKSDKPTEQRSFVLADADLFSDLVLKNVPTNRFLLLDAVRWLSGEESLSGEVNSEEDVRIEHTKNKDVLWFYATILGIPILVLGLGLGWSRRIKNQGGKR
jgi:hypothetical protein